MDSPSKPYLHKLQKKVDCKNYGTNIILRNYQLLKNIKKNYNGIALSLEYERVGRSSWINYRNID